MSAQEETTATILRLPGAAGALTLEEAADIARQMDENEERWRALEAEIEPRHALSPEAEEKKKESGPAKDESLAKKNIWYRKDASGTSPGARYFSETDVERDARIAAKRAFWRSVNWCPPGSWK